MRRSYPSWALLRGQPLKRLTTDVISLYSLYRK